MMSSEDKEKIELTQDEFDTEYTIKETIPKDIEKDPEQDRITEYDTAIGATDAPENMEDSE